MNLFNRYGCDFPHILSFSTEYLPQWQSSPCFCQGRRVAGPQGRRVTGSSEKVLGTPAHKGKAGTRVSQSVSLTYPCAPCTLYVGRTIDNSLTLTRVSICKGTGIGIICITHYLCDVLADSSFIAVIEQRGPRTRSQTLSRTRAQMMLYEAETSRLSLSKG